MNWLLGHIAGGMVRIILGILARRCLSPGGPTVRRAADLGRQSLDSHRHRHGGRGAWTLHFVRHLNERRGDGGFAAK